MQSTESSSGFPFWKRLQLQLQSTLNRQVAEWYVSALLAGHASSSAALTVRTREGCVCCIGWLCKIVCRVVLLLCNVFFVRIVIVYVGCEHVQLMLPVAGCLLQNCWRGCGTAQQFACCYFVVQWRINDQVVYGVCRCRCSTGGHVIAYS